MVYYLDIQILSKIDTLKDRDTFKFFVRLTDIEIFCKIETKKPVMKLMPGCLVFLPLNIFRIISFYRNIQKKIRNCSCFPKSRKNQGFASATAFNLDFTLDSRT